MAKVEVSAPNSVTYEALKSVFLPTFDDDQLQRKMLGTQAFAIRHFRSEWPYSVQLFCITRLIKGDFTTYDIDNTKSLNGYTKCVKGLLERWSLLNEAGAFTKFSEGYKTMRTQLEELCIETGERELNVSLHKMKI